MIIRFIRTIISYVLFIFLVLLIAIPMLIFILLPARWRYDNKLFYWLANFFYKATLWLIFVPVEFEGKENIPDEPAIIAPNHQSALDLPLVGALMNCHPHLWMAWSKLARYWIGPVVKRMAILIDLTSSMSAMRSLVKALKMLEGKKRHVIIFPEGGRYIDGNKVHDFFGGFVIIAKKTGRPVVPVLILDAYKVYPPGSFFIYRHPIKVKVGKPFYYQESEGDDAFKARVRKWFLDNVKD